MPIVKLCDFRPARCTAITLGTFDGLHLGHRALLERAAHWARVSSLQSVAFVFTQPPQNFFGVKKPLITPIEKKLAALEELVDAVVAVEFPEIGWMEAEEFVRKILVAQLRAKVIVIGPDARFGKGRRGDLALLCELGRTLNFSTDVIPPVLVNGRVVSSTAIRESLLAGCIEEARELLGCAPKLCGIVVRGDGRGRQLGYPTANLAVADDVLVPAAGVYAVQVVYEDTVRNGVLYIGARSTFAGASPSVEVHVFDTEAQLYGLELEAQLLKRLRGDRRFSSLEALRAQIEADIQAARAALQSYRLDR